MKIAIDGVNTVNKGAELMLYAILQEIERKQPDAEVLFNQLGERSSYIQTPLNFKTRPFSRLISILNRFRIPGILRRLSIPYSFFTQKYAIKNIDVVLDAGGFQFSDQWNVSDSYLFLWEKYYKKLKDQNTKIILLPQAFGPFYTKNGKRSAAMISQYTDIIFAREKVSYNHLIEAGVDENKIKLYPDFTALVEGIIPKQYESLKGYVCIIPNMRMVDKNKLSINKYIDGFIQIINLCKESNKQLFLLNHEGIGDLKLCQMINNKLNGRIPIVTNMNALEVKGLISQCYMTISSRFHGVASSLSTGVPCLATSWSHKYEMLFNDFGIENCILNLDTDEYLTKIQLFLDLKYNQYIRKQLQDIIPRIKNSNQELWNITWEAIYSHSTLKK